ncbi:MAG: HD domain-containing protein [Chloroflexi bacterium]|nr:HD domain-containing protein [Chloroflexota bacterium]
MAFSGQRVVDVAPRQSGITVEVLVWVFRMSLAPAVFLLLRWDPFLDQLMEAPQAHFVIVSAASILGLVLAWIVAEAARSHQDARVFFVALAFFGVAGIFLMHALSTQSVLLAVGQTGFIWSPPLSFLLGGALFTLSTVRFNDRWNGWILVNQNRLLAAFITILLGYAVLVVLFPDLVVGGLGVNSGTSTGDYSVSAEGGAVNQVLILLLVLSLATYAVAAARYFAMYRRRPSVLVASLLNSAVLFAEADAIGAFSTVWHFSWWLYHIVMVFAFLIASYGVLVQFSRNRNVQGLFSEVFLREQLARLNAGYTEAIIALINSLEARDRYTKGHSARVAQYAVIIARAIGYDEESVSRVEQSALLHDIGKLAIPDAILNKPGRLTPEEFAIIQSHPARGCAIIEAIDSLSDKVPGIRHHHEWLDGSGYPDGLVGDAIPLDARIIAVADVYDALTSRRAYREPMSHEGAVEHLHSQVPHHLQGSLVDAFVAELARERPLLVDMTTPQARLDELFGLNQPVSVSS